MGCGGSKTVNINTNNHTNDNTESGQPQTPPQSPEQQPPAGQEQPKVCKSTESAAPVTEHAVESSHPLSAHPDEKGETSEFSELELLALKVHNKYRALHGAPPLELNREICDMARKYSQHLAKTGKFDHSKDKDRRYKGKSCGENLYMSMGTAGGTGEAESAVRCWYDEIKDYNFSNPGFNMDTGHFTQVLWKGSKLLGVGIGSKGTSHVITANYWPAGNMMGDFPENVGPLS